MKQKSIPKASFKTLYEFENGDKILQEFLKGWQPPTTLTVSQWADKHRLMPSETTNEPGLWRTKRTPYLKEIMDELSVSSSMTTVAVMKGAQIGLTEGGNNWIGYVVDVAPTTMLVLMPSEKLIQAANEQKLTPMFKTCPTLANKIIKVSGKEKADTKRFPGGRLFLRTAGSANNLRSMSAKNIFLDEVDSMLANVSGEGDPIELARTRANSFGDDKKIFIISTPTVKGASIIEREFLLGDQRYYFLPCPFCEHYQDLKWEHIKYTPDEYGIVHEAFYKCENCGKLIPENEKATMLEKGFWKPTARAKELNRASFHISSMYSQIDWYSWREMASDYEKARTDENKLVQFFNTKLGLTYELQGNSPPWRMIYDQREDYELQKVPQDALFLTAGVDTQPDRLEYEIVAWAKDKQSWSIDYGILEGNPDEPEVWEKLEQVLNSDFEHKSGNTMNISIMAIDTGGRNTQSVYGWCLKQRREVGYGRKGVSVWGSKNIMPIKGRDIQDLMVPAPNRIEVNGVKNALRLWTVGVSCIKKDVYSCLNIDRPTDKELLEGGVYKPRTCHFPKAYDDEYFKQLTSEKQMIQNTKNGGYKVAWVKDPSVRNEALDVRVYARAAAHIMGLDNPSKNWASFENRLTASDDTEGSSKATDSQTAEQILAKFQKQQSLV